MKQQFDAMLQEEIASNGSLWHKILERLLHVVFFFWLKGDSLLEVTLRPGDKSNSLFLGLLEVVAKCTSYNGSPKSVI